MSLIASARLWYGLAFVAAGVVGASAGAPVRQQPALAAQSPANQLCRVEGHVTSGRDPLPGVSVVVHAGDNLKAATSTDIDGKFTIVFAPNATYRLTADLTAFAAIDRTITLGAPPCDTTADFQLALRPRREPGPRQLTPLERDARAEPPANTAAARPAPARPDGRNVRAVPRGRTRRPRQQRAERPRRTVRGFQTLEVQADANGEATLGLASTDDAADAARLLPSGFSLQDAQADAVAISGSNDATSLDRGLLNDRTQAIALGQFDPATGQFAQGFGPQAGQAFGGDPGAAGQFGGGRGGGPGGGGGGGFFLGGRGARGQSPYQGTATYTFGGSALNTAPYQINPTVPADAAAVRAEHVRHDVRRSAQDSRPLQGHEPPDEFPGELHRQPIEQRLRSIRDGADARDAQRRFFRHRSS